MALPEKRARLIRRVIVGSIFAFLAYKGINLPPGLIDVLAPDRESIIDRLAR